MTTEKDAKAMLKAIIPPIAWKAAQKVKEAVVPIKTGWFVAEDPKSAFSKAATHWNGKEIARTYERRWLQFEKVLSTPVPPAFASEAEAPLFDPKTDVVSEQSLLRHNAVLGLVFAVAHASRQRPQLSMLDWGGGVGHQYGLLRKLLPALKLDYTCFDLPVSADFGSSRFPEARFTSDFACLKTTYDIVVANGSLHCFEHWQNIADQLAEAASEFLFITMLPVVLNGPSTVMTQRWENSDGTSYSEPEWFVSRDELLARFPTGKWELRRELICGCSPTVQGSDALIDYRGFLFERTR